MADMAHILGFWPDHKKDMACLVSTLFFVGSFTHLVKLLADISTWRSELKSIALSIAPTAYSLVPSQTLAPRERSQWVKAEAAKLLDESLFLRNGFDENVSANIFCRS